MLFRVTARCLLLRDGHILVQLSKHGDFYRLPGGRVRPEETILQGLQRELREELGLEKIGDPELVYIVESFYRRRSGIVHEIGFYFLCRPGNGEEIKPKEEHLRIKWVPLDDITPEVLRPSVLAPYIKKMGNGGLPRKPLYLVNVDIEHDHY
jgi:8-oxo-dGTP pyrophosphatase MutT (NUDIX family)